MSDIIEKNEDAEEPKPHKVYDEETDDFVEVSVEMQKRANAVHLQIALNAISTAIGIKRMRDEKLYLGFGCQSFSEYIETRLPFTRRQAYNYIQIAERFIPFLPDISKDEYVVHSGAQHITEMGYNKLFALSGLPDDQFSKIVDGEDGVTLDELADMDTKEFASALTKYKKKHSKTLAQMDEQNKSLKDENRILKEKLAEADQRLEDAKALEAKFGKGGFSLESKRKILELARKEMLAAEQYVFQLNLEESDTIGLQKEVAIFIRRWDEVHKRMMMNYGFVVRAAEL